MNDPFTALRNLTARLWQWPVMHAGLCLSLFAGLLI